MSFNLRTTQPQAERVKTSASMARAMLGEIEQLADALGGDEAGEELLRGLEPVLRSLSLDLLRRVLQPLRSARLKAARQKKSS